MAVQSSFYSGTALDSRTFPSTKHIATKAHMAVWLRQVSDDIWVQMNVADYQLINNACVLNVLINTATYYNIEVRVADEPNELLDTPTDIAIVAGIADEVVAVATDPLKTAILDASGISYGVTTIEDLLLVDIAYGTVIVRDEDRGGTFNYDVIQSAVNNDITIFNGWVRDYDGAIDVKWAGAVGDGATDDTAAIQAALDLGDCLFDGGAYLISSQLTISNTYREIQFLNGAFITCSAKTFTALSVEATSVRLKDIWIKGALVGVQCGTVSVKSNFLTITNIKTSKCSIGFKCLFGNNGRMITGYFEGDDAVLTDIGAEWDGESLNSNGWFVYGVRAFDCSTGFKLTGNAADNRYCDDSFFYVSAEDYSDIGFHISGGIRNQVNLYSETDPSFPSAVGYQDDSGTRSNYAFLNGTAKAVGISNGLANTIDPTEFITRKISSKTSTTDMTSGKTKEIIVSNEFITVNAVSGTQTLSLTKLDTQPIGSSNFLFFPKGNISNVLLGLEAPFVLLDNGVAGKTIFDGDYDQLFRLTKISDALYDLVDISSTKELPLQTVVKSITGTTTLGMAYKSGTLIYMNNTSGVTRTVTLTGVSALLIGTEFTIVNQSADIVQMPLDSGAYVNGGTAGLLSNSSGVWRKIDTDLYTFTLADA